METKTARLTLLIDPIKKKAFEELCAAQDITPSQVVRQMIRDYLELHRMDYATKSRIGAADVGAGLKLTICAGLKLTRRYSGVAYYTAVGKSTRLGRL